MLARTENTAPPAPVSPEGLTAAWFQTMLSRQLPGVRIDSARLVERIAGASTKLRFELTGDGPDLPRRIMVKGGFEPHSAAMALMHQNEMNAYGDLLTTLDIDTPRCFYAGEDGNGLGLVVLEDLDLRSASFLSLQAPLDFDRAAKFLDQMARYHARWWNEPNLASRFPWAQDTRAARGSHYFDILLDPSRFAVYRDAPRGAALARCLLDPARIAAAHNALTDLHQSMPHTMLHGDAHLGNLYTASDGQPAFLDWQPRRGPWSLDVTYFMISALDVVDRRRWETALLQHYLSCLATYAVTPPGFDDAYDAYRKDVVWGLLIWLLNGTEFQTESNNTAAASRFGNAMTDHDTFARLGV